MGTWLRRLAYLLRQSRHDAELREEIEAHRALRAAQMERDGLSSLQAAAASRRAMGNVLLAGEDVREAWLGSWSTWWQDVRYGVRTLRKDPLFTIVAMATLACGIGVNAGMFTIVNGVLLRDFPAPDPHELVSLSQTVSGVPGLIDAGGFSTSQYEALRDRAQALSAVLAVGNAVGETTLGGDAPQKVYGALVSCNYFTVLRQRPTLGRELTARDCQPGAAPVVVLGRDLWRTAFASNPAIVGRTIELNRQRFVVVGVAAEGTYQGPIRLGYFAPINAGRLLSPSDMRYENDKFLWLSLIGRLRDGIDLAQVRAEFDVITAHLDRQQPGRTTTLRVERAKPLTVPRNAERTAAAVAAVLMAAFGFILLMACANIANLLLARSASRSQEIEIRLALGASRVRVVRQLLTESLLISCAAGLLGSVVSFWCFQALITLAVPALLPPDLPIAPTWNLSPDARVLSFAVLLTVATTIVFGLAPALHASRSDPHASMKQASTAGSSRRGMRLRATLVGLQVALCMILMIGAALLLRGLYVTYTIDPGFTYRNVAYISLESAHEGYTPEDTAVRRQRLIAEVAALPGVEAVAYAEKEPLGDDFAPIAVRLPGEDERDARNGEVTAVSKDYFSLLELPIVRGRPFTDSEVWRKPTGVRPAIVSESTARNLWPGGDPLGQTFLSQTEMLRVVGVAADAQVSTLGRVDPYYIYVPGGGSLLLIKSRADFTAMASRIRTAVTAFDSSLVVAVLPLEATLGWWRGISRTVTTLASALGLLALVLASVGIFGVVSYALTARYREIGVRIALGATAWTVVRMVLHQTMRPVCAGAVIGAAAASGVSRVLSSVLFGVSPADPIGLWGAVLFVLGVALAAGLMAARPATHGDPVVMLRCE